MSDKSKIYRLQLRIDGVTLKVLEELELKQKLKQSTKISKSECIRRLILNTDPSASFAIQKQLEELTYEIHKIGINVNQLVKNYNSGIYNPGDKQQLKDYLEQLVDRLDQIEKQIAGGAK